MATALLTILVPALAQPVAGGAMPSATSEAPDGRTTARSLSAWLLRMHEASRRRSYMGTFVVSSDGQMATSRIWHACDGRQQLERVDSLSGALRSTFRRNEQVITFVPDSKVAIAERRESLGLFPARLRSDASAIDQFYTAQPAGVERVAGFAADVLQIKPRDKLRFGYRVWSEQKTGLVVKLETQDLEGRVLEQVAFSELQLDAPVSMDKLSRMMARTEGYRVERADPVQTTAADEGWVLKTPVPGFQSMSCQRRPGRGEGQRDDTTVQWIFSDGLASVSLFIEPYDPRRHLHEGPLSMGATQTLSRRLAGPGQGWWLTAVGEVPPQTLMAFAQGLERKK